MSVLLLLFWELVLSAFYMCKNVNFQFLTVSFLAYFHDVNRVLQTMIVIFLLCTPQKTNVSLL